MSDLTGIEHMFDAWEMPPPLQQVAASNAESEFANGYDQGRATCLTHGAEAAHRWLATHRVRPARASSGEARHAGYAQAVWDYEDANGLPHPPRLHLAT